MPSKWDQAQKTVGRSHVPFRADDLQHGKKTGRHIKSVSRDSGGFELFDQMMDEAYTNGRGPKPTIKPRLRPSLDEEIGDEDGDEFYQPQPEEDAYDFAPDNPSFESDDDDPDINAEPHPLDVDNEHESQEELQEEPHPPQPEEVMEEEEVTRPKRQKKKGRQLVEFLDNDDDESAGLRRSKRRHYPPLEYWRQERVVWGRRDNGRSVVPVIKEIITIPKPEPEPLGVKRRKRGTRRLRSKSLASSPPPGKEEIRIIEVDNPELGWDEDTPSTGVIIDWSSKEEVERRVAYPARMVSPKPAQGCDYFFHKIFGDGDFIAAGQLVIPPGAEKPTKPTKDNTYIFYVMQGAIECKVHRTSFVLATGGSFMVPRGNQYYIKNICSRDVKLFFAQARKVPANEVAAPSIIRPRASTVPRAPTPE